MSYEIGFRLAITNQHGTPYVSLRVMAREKGCNYPVNVNNSHTMSPVWNADYPVKARGFAFDGLELRSHVMLPYTETTTVDLSLYYKVHSLSVVVRDCYQFDVKEAQAYAKAMAKIEKAIYTQASDHEHGDVLEAAAKAIGATFVCLETTKGRGSSFSDSDWLFMSIAEGKRTLRYKINEMERKAQEDNLRQ